MSLPTDDVTNWVETVLDTISGSFKVAFPPGTLDEVVRLHELCILRAWTEGPYKRSEFVSMGFEQTCRAAKA